MANGLANLSITSRAQRAFLIRQGARGDRGPKGDSGLMTKIVQAQDVDMVNATNGSLLIWNPINQTFIAGNDLNNIILDGGIF